VQGRDLLKPRKKDQRGGTAPQDMGELYRNRQHDPRRKFERKPLPGVEETMSGAGLEPDRIMQARWLTTVPLGNYRSWPI
jgi:hypothetical protein